MSLNFKSFIKIRFLLGIFIPIFLFFFGIIIYMPKDKNAQAAYILNPNNRDIVELGKSVYVQNCASCHGVKLEGQKDWMSRLPDGLMPAPPHDETGHTWHHSDKYLFMITKYGLKILLVKNMLIICPLTKTFSQIKKLFLYYLI